MNCYGQESGKENSWKKKKLKYDSKLEQKQDRKQKPAGIETIIKRTLNEENKIINRRSDLTHGKKLIYFFAKKA